MITARRWKAESGDCFSQGAGRSIPSVICSAVWIGADAAAGLSVSDGHILIEPITKNTFNNI